MNNEQRTLDAQHSKNINKLTTERSQVDKLKTELKKLEKEYKKLDKKKVKERSFTDNSRIGELSKIIGDHKSKINDITAVVENMLLNVSDIAKQKKVPAKQTMNNTTINNHTKIINNFLS